MKFNTQNVGVRFSVAMLLALGTVACTRPAEPTVKRIKAGQEYAGFLKDYSRLAQNPNVEGNVKTFVEPDTQKNLHRYIAIIVDPVQVYLASDTDAAKVSDATRAVVANYFRAALTNAVADAFPPVDQPGPLVLRLRSAIIGVDAGGQAGAANISKVGVEMELVDSETGAQIAAVVDREPLGSGAEVGAENMTREEKYAAARAAFDEWASRLRTFLNAAHELTAEDAKRADSSYRPYGEARAAR